MMKSLCSRASTTTLRGAQSSMRTPRILSCCAASAAACIIAGHAFGSGGASDELAISQSVYPWMTSRRTPRTSK
jgi:hypothetical protein